MGSKNQSRSVSRRNLLKFGAGVLGTSAIAAGLSSEILTPRRAIATENLTPDQAIDVLIEGNRRFVDRKRKYPHQDFVRLTEVAMGQKPFAAVLGCADSRVPTEMVFDQGLGDLFVCRVAGNVVTDEEVGSLEYGAAVLGTKVILVMGHERCGAVSAALKGAQVPGKIGSLIEAIRPAIAGKVGSVGSKEAYPPLEAATKANVLYQVEKLKTSPVLAQLIQAGKLKVIGAYYDLDTGTVTRLA
ncbi:MAG: carbonic anhydrase [Leptolyngbyaceae cyanobacterium RU_5_1]|nr:carbonic anhydrase [Leptolyngbyaceae cyanobacterium RU_5_1]